MVRVLNLATVPSPLEFAPRILILIKRLTPQIRSLLERQIDTTPERFVAHQPGAVVPRWEWRIFAPSLVAIEVGLSGLAAAVARASVEIYLLHLGGPQNAKIRDDTLDVKRLREVGRTDLELWEPVFKARFPLTRADVAIAFAEWQIALPRLDRESYTSDQFLKELIGPQSALVVAHVTKSRRGFEYLGCIAEFVRLSVDSIPLESFSLEHEEPGRILNGLRRLGLQSRANTNYPTALKRELGLSDACLQRA